jgi:hypothetical protein
MEGERIQKNKKKTLTFACDTVPKVSCDTSAGKSGASIGAGGMRAAIVSFSFIQAFVIVWQEKGKKRVKKDNRASSWGEQKVAKLNCSIQGHSQRTLRDKSKSNFRLCLCKGRAGCRDPGWHTHPRLKAKEKERKMNAS